jgi:hypothetical protein
MSAVAFAKIRFSVIRAKSSLALEICSLPVPTEWIYSEHTGCEWPAGREFPCLADPLGWVCGMHPFYP